MKITQHILIALLITAGIICICLIISGCTNTPTSPSIDGNTISADSSQHRVSPPPRPPREGYERRLRKLGE